MNTSDDGVLNTDGQREARIVSNLLDDLLSLSFGILIGIAGYAAWMVP